MHTLTVKTVVDGRLDLQGPFAMKDALKALPGALWAPSRKAWHVPATQAAILEVHRRFGTNTELQLDDGATSLLFTAIEATKATVHKTATDLEPLPGKTAAWGHQNQAGHFAAAQEAAMLAMGMGTGKSRTLIGMLEKQGATSVVIMCPRRAVPVWPREFALHALRDWHVISPPQKMTVAKRATFIQREIQTANALGKPFAVAVNTEAAWRNEMALTLLDRTWDVGVIDESHRVKAPGGKASKFAALLGKKCKRRYCLTGTPMPHSPLDIYGQYRFLDPGVFGTSFHRFRSRYAIMGGYEMRQVVGYQNEDELNERWGALAFICGEEVLDLPPYHHVQQFTELEPAARKLYEAIDEDFVATAKEGTVTADNALVKLLRLQQVTSGKIKNDDGDLVEVSTAKAELLEEVLEDFAEHEPLVVCARFTHDLVKLREICAKQGRRYGEISGNVSESSPDYGLDSRAMMRDDIDVCGVQIQAGGVGIDLTRAAYCILYSVGYSLGDYEQFLKRVHRPGQTRPTTYIHLIVQGTKDEAVYHALSERKNVVEAMIEQARGDNNDR